MDRTIELEGSDIFLCKIRNVLVDKYLCDETLTVEERMNMILPVQSIRQSYFRWDGTSPGDWGTPLKSI